MRWGDYAPTEIAGDDGKAIPIWQRSPHEVTVPINLKDAQDPVTYDVSASGGLQLHVLERAVVADELAAHLPQGTRSVSLFLVNRRAPDEANPDVAYVFQTEIEVTGDAPFVPRPDLRGSLAAEWDEQVADLHYAGTPEYATGHGVSADWKLSDSRCRLLRTAWIPNAEVEKTETLDIEGVELSMDSLGSLPDAAAVSTALTPLVEQYRAWIERQRAGLAGLTTTRRETAEELLRLAGVAAGRIERGVAALASDPDALDAFRVANRGVAHALRKRLHIEAPRWRAFQLAFLLLNLPELVDPRDPHRETVDLLFSGRAVLSRRRRARRCRGKVGPALRPPIGCARKTSPGGRVQAAERPV